jgi:hypothetical protein
MQEACNALNRRTEFRVLRTTYGLFEQLKSKTQAKDAKEEKQEQGGSEETEAEEANADEESTKEETAGANDHGGQEDEVEVDPDDDFIP